MTYVVLPRYGHGYEIFSLAYDRGSNILASSCKVSCFLEVYVIFLFALVSVKGI